MSWLNDKRRLTFESMRRLEPSMAYMVTGEIRSTLKAFEEKAAQDGESIDWATLRIETSADPKMEVLLVDMNITTVSRVPNPFEALMLGLANAARSRKR